MTLKLRWALIGASDIAETRVLPAIRANGGTATVVRTGNLEHGKDWAKRNNISEIVTDLAQALDRPDIDAVYISSLNSQHRAHVEAAALAGKHVLAEKPLAMSVQDAREMVIACERASVVMATNHHLPVNPVHRMMKRMVQAGDIGDIRAIRFHHAVQLPARLAGWRSKAKSEGGVVYDVTVHDAAAIAAILGTNAISVSAIGLNQDNDESGPEDAVMTNILWEGGVLVETHDSYNNAHVPTSVHILGTTGSLIGENCNTGDPVGTLALVRNSQYENIEVGARVDLYSQIIHEFTSAVAGTGKVHVDGEAGVRSLAVSVAVQEAMRSGERVLVSKL